MAWRRVAFLLVVVLVSLSVSVPTEGISSTSLDRTVRGAVVPDGEAYLGIQRDCHNGTLTVAIANQFPVRTTLQVDLTVNGTTKTIPDLRAGQTRTRRFAVAGTGDTVSIATTGAVVSVRTTRPVPAGC